MSELLQVRDVSIEYRVGRRTKFTAVNSVSFDIATQETFALIGESGSGKTTTARAVLGLLRPVSGTITLEGDPVMTPRGKRAAAANRISVVLQDPNEALNPRKRIMQSIVEPLEIRGWKDDDARRRRGLELLESMGLGQRHADCYPHQLSGGQKQRANIARALTIEPVLMVCDEPVSALDVSIQADIINMLSDLRTERGVASLFVSHDLGVVAHLADRIAVMYLGEIVEVGTTESLIENPLHPYTRALLDSQPQLQPSWKRRERVSQLSGEIPSPLNPPSGCRFRTRCPHVMEICAAQKPQPIQRNGDHSVACHLYSDEQEVRIG